MYLITLQILNLYRGLIQLKISGMVKMCLHFPESFFKEISFSEQELISAKEFFLRVFNKNLNTEISHKHIHFGQLMKAIPLANRFPRCKASLSFLYEGFKANIHPNWGPKYNLIFMGTSIQNGVLGVIYTQSIYAIIYRIPFENPWDVISQIKFHRTYSELNINEKRKCENIRILVKEIFALTKKITLFLRERSDLLNFQDLFSLLDRYNYLFSELFRFRVIDIEYGGILEPFRKYRNSLAHHHLIFGGTGPLIPVEWKYRRNRPFRVIGTLSINTHEIYLEISLICVIVSQIMGLYQFADQIL